MSQENTGMLRPGMKDFFSVADMKNIMFRFLSTGKKGVCCQKLGLGKWAGRCRESQQGAGICRGGRMGAGSALLGLVLSSFLKDLFFLFWRACSPEGGQCLLHQGVDVWGRQEDQFPFGASLHFSCQPPILEQTSQEVRKNVSLSQHLNHQFPSRSSDAKSEKLGPFGPCVV